MIKKAKHPTNKLERLNVEKKHSEAKELRKASYVRLIKEGLKEKEAHDELRRAYNRDEYFPG